VLEEEGLREPVVLGTAAFSLMRSAGKYSAEDCKTARKESPKDRCSAVKCNAGDDRKC
jgi:hypothetical protein